MGGGRPKILNLFAYTAGSTLAAAAAGAEVVHVDSAKNIVAWARRNAELSGLADAPIHWITEDAMKFVKREIKRGNTLRRPDPRSAQLRPWTPGRSLAAFQTSAATAGHVRRFNRRSMPIHSSSPAIPRATNASDLLIC